MISSLLLETLRQYPERELQVVTILTVVAISIFDDDLSESEFMVIAGACDAWEIDLRSLDPFLDYKPDELLAETLLVARQILSPSGRLWFLGVCINAAKADDKLLYGEQILLMMIADALGIPHTLLKERYARETGSTFPDVGDPSARAFYQREQSDSKRTRSNSSAEQEVNNDEVLIRELLAILDLVPGCTADDVKTAYRKKVLVCHPDRFFNDDEESSRKRHEEFLRVKSAYEQLMVIYA